MLLKMKIVAEKTGSSGSEERWKVERNPLLESSVIASFKCVHMHSV